MIELAKAVKDACQRKFLPENGQINATCAFN